jgi:hypothetical protein
MSTTTAAELKRILKAKADLKTAINNKGGNITNETIDKYASQVNELPTPKEEETKIVTPDFSSGNVDVTPTSGKVMTQVTINKDSNLIADNIKKDVTVHGITGTLESGGAELPSTAGGSIFTGATIPLTYKNNTHDYENNYEYKSATHNITITGLDGRATITGNGTKNVLVAFDVTSSTTSLKNFTITCVNGDQELTYKGLHAHYGETVTGILTFAYNNITHDGSEGTFDTSGLTANYKFIVTSSSDLPVFSNNTTLWNTIYSHQLLNVLIGNFSGTSIGNYFMSGCYAFNQPLTLPSSLNSIGSNFMNYCRAFNQPLTLPSGLSSIGESFMSDCYAFNQPLTLPSSLNSIGSNFMNYCRAFNQPLTLPSSLNSIGTGFMRECYSLSTIIWNASVYPTDNNSLSQDINTKTNSTYGAGIKVYGTKRAGLISALPNRTSSPYRKLINGGS